MLPTLSSKGAMQSFITLDIIFLFGNDIPLDLNPLAKEELQLVARKTFPGGFMIDVLFVR